MDTLQFVIIFEPLKKDRLYLMVSFEFESDHRLIVSQLVEERLKKKGVLFDCEFDVNNFNVFVLQEIMNVGLGRGLVEIIQTELIQFDVPHFVVKEAQLSFIHPVAAKIKLFKCS